MATFNDLPPEILSHILTFLPAKDIATFSMVCKSFYNTCSVESVWENRCKTDYNIDANNIAKDISFYDVYTKILHHYGFTLGLWQADIESYGGILRVQFVGEKLIGTQYSAPVDPHLEDALRSKTAFTVEVGTDGATKVLCHRGYNGTHDSCIELRDGCLLFQCGAPANHRHPNGEQHEFSKWLVEETNNNIQNFLFQGQDLLVMKFRVMSMYEKKTGYSQLTLPKRLDDVPIQPGLFKGNYGSHGIEIVLVTYNEDNTEMNAIKISGDPNIPAKKITIKADLTRPIILNREQQDSIETLSDIDTADLPPDTNIKQIPSQPFNVPMGCHDRDRQAPDRCKLRYHSQGQIAGHGYTNHQFIPGHWIIFDEDTFGHLWLELHSFSMFIRVKEDL